MADASSTSLIVLKELAGHPVPQLDPIQQFLAAHYPLVQGAWIALWCMTSIVVLANLWYEYKAQKKDK
jgi:hypothetical protein